MEFQIVCTRRSKSCRLLSVLAAQRKRHWTSLSWTRSQRLEEFSLPLPWSFLGFSTLCTALSWRGWCLRGCRGGYFGRTLWARRSFAAAAGILYQRLARPAATLLGVMFFLFVVLLHIPRIATHPSDGNEWTSGFVALAMSGGAWVLARNSPLAGRETSAPFLKLGRYFLP